MRRRRFLAGLGLAPVAAKSLDLDDVLEAVEPGTLATSPDELVDVELGEAVKYSRSDHSHPTYYLVATESDLDGLIHTAPAGSIADVAETGQRFYLDGGSSDLL